MRFLEFMDEWARRTSLPVEALRIAYTAAVDILLEQAAAGQHVTLWGFGTAKQGSTGKFRVFISKALQDRFQREKEDFDGKVRRTGG